MKTIFHKQKLNFGLMITFGQTFKGFLHHATFSKIMNKEMIIACEYVSTSKKNLIKINYFKNELIILCKNRTLYQKLCIIQPSSSPRVQKSKSYIL